MVSNPPFTHVYNNLLRVDPVEEAFSCFLVHRPETEMIEKAKKYLQENFSAIPPDLIDQNIKQFLNIAGTIKNQGRLKLLFELIENLVTSNVVTPKVVCDSILTCDHLQLANNCFWIESFHLIRRIINGVDYKGVREIMKACFEKISLVPRQLTQSTLPLLRALESILKYIFDRDVCLLPSYFIVNEIQKHYPENKTWPHWLLAGMFSSFVENFRPIAQMVSIIGHSEMLPIVEHSNIADHLINPWKLDPILLRFPLKGNLPFNTTLLQPQTLLLRWVLEQPYSRDMVCTMLGLQKQHKHRCVALEEQLVELLIIAMERSEVENTSEGDDLSNSHLMFWLHLSNQLIYFVLFQFANFSSIVLALHDKIVARDLRKGRDHLMWVLLQFISGSIQRNPLSNFIHVLKLYDLLYPEKDPLPLPDCNKSICIHKMAVTSIWIHLLKKAQTDQISLQRPIPNALKLHHEFLQHVSNNFSLSMVADYKIALLCNAYSTSTDYFTRPMAAFVETILGNQKALQPPVLSIQNNAALANGPTVPLSMSLLDSLTVHAKMSLIHSIVSHMIKLGQSKSNIPIAPACVETYSRLLVYTEIESLGIKGFISHVLPSIYKSHACGILYMLLEMFSYRMHHIQPHYRVQLLSTLHNLAAVPQTNQTQLHLCVESTALRLITGLGSAEVQPQLSSFLNEPNKLVSTESEELNRALVLTLARSMHVSGTGMDSNTITWCLDLLNTIMQNTPHSWSNHTLQCFPPVISEFFQNNSVPEENKQQLKKAVEEEYRNWVSMNNENDIIAHFSVPGTPPLFLCLLWKMILETDRITPIAYKILERIGARALTTHLRKFCDYLVFEFVISQEGSQHVNKCVDAVNSMIWKYNIITIDRLVLCMALRTQEGNEAQVNFFIIQLLLFKAPEFRNRVAEFVKENSPEHWKQSNWHEKHLAFHRKYPEKFAPEGILEQNPGSSSPYQCLPVYFGNVCLRFLPVFDILIHRYLEIPAVSKSLETLLDHLGCLYKFHDRPVTYLYNTLHCYEKKLCDRPALKKRLVSSVLNSISDVRPAGWALSEPYMAYMMANDKNDITWIPDLDYYIKLVRRIVETMSGNSQFPPLDWRFNEFPNPSAHALYITCVELMALPCTIKEVGTNLLDVISRGFTVIPMQQMPLWINAIGLIMAALPESYWRVLHDRILEVLTLPRIMDWKKYYIFSPFDIFNFNKTHYQYIDNKFSYTLATAHSMWHHARIGQITAVPKFVNEKLVPVIKTEEQFLFLCHLVGPFLHRFNTEHTKWVMDLTIGIYTALEQVDKNCETMIHMDTICDLLYHIKYMFVGDSLKNEVNAIIRNLRQPLLKRLRFITHISIDQIADQKSEIKPQPPQQPSTLQLQTTQLQQQIQLQSQSN